MSVTAKKIITDFLNSDVFVNPSSFDTYFHKDLKMNWHASSGYRQYDYQEYFRIAQTTAASYESTRSDVTHLITQGDQVVARFTVYVKTLENPREEVPVGYFISIFKVQEGKIIEVHQSSHPSQQ